MSDVKKAIRLRVYLAFTGFCLFSCMILARALYLQTVAGPELREKAKRMHMRTAELPAERGNIYTEQGDLLCSTVPQFTVHVDFSVIDSALFWDNVDTLSMQLSALYADRSATDYQRALTKAYVAQERYWLLRKNVPYFEYQQLRGFNIFKKGKNKGGFIAESKITRVNPYGMLAYRTIGLWRENAQTVGMEATYDSVLRGHKGSRVEQKMIGGGWMPVPGSEIESKNGKDVVTTLDMEIQGIAEYAVKSILEKYDLQYGTCVVMEVPTGKIRALVNLGYQEQTGDYWEDFNYAMVPTEPGSVFKLVTLTALFNNKYITTESMVDAKGGTTMFGNQVMKDAHNGGRMTVKEAFAHSSNIAHATMLQKYFHDKPELYLETVKKLHMNQRTGIDLKGERKPVVKTPGKGNWSKNTLPWMAMGYEVQITPLHTCMLYNALANNGRMMKPYLISEIKEYGKTIFKKEPTVLEEAIGDSATIAQLKACAEEVAITGTAKGIKSPYYAIAGKTGTAQVADKGIGYPDGVYQGSFVGYFPANAPRYTIAVVMRTKKHAGTYYGGSIAAPVFRMVADKIFASGRGWPVPVDSISKKDNKVMIAQKATGTTYNVLMNAINKAGNVPNENIIQQVKVDSNRSVIAVAQKIYKGSVPDVSGMSLRDAVYLLEKEGLSIHIKGKGKVRAQSIAPGTIATKGLPIVLELS